jgi:hypothetical protein
MHITERANVTRSQIHGRSSEYVTDSRRLIKKKKRDLINGKEPLLRRRRMATYLSNNYSSMREHLHLTCSY